MVAHNVINHDADTARVLNSANVLGLSGTFCVIPVKAENTGIAGVYHNKGGILVQFCIGQTRLTFLSAHLAAHEGKYKTRNDHLREILKGARPNPKHLAGLDAALASHHMFVMGDLNYRARIEAEDVAAAKDDADAAHEAKVNRALELIRAGDFAGLYARDELSDGLRKREVLCGFQTPPCHFSPTFKLLRQEGFHYKSQRVPRYVYICVVASCCRSVATHALTFLGFHGCDDDMGLAVTRIVFSIPVRPGYPTDCATCRTNPVPALPPPITNPFAVLLRYSSITVRRATVVMS